MVATPKTLGEDEHVVDDKDARIRLLNEVWRPVPDYEDRYEVSSLGRVRSLPVRGGNSRTYGGRIKKTHTGSNGYQVVGLSVNGVCTRLRVHELVVRAFHGDRPDWAHCIRHLDGNPAYNTPWNCVWGTDSENILDTVRHGRHAHAGGRPRIEAKKEN